MGTPTVGTFFRRLRQAMAAEALAETPDRDLIERFRAERDEAAFRALVERHGPMVFQVCRRTLACHADVEDAFQATFLVLVRRGHAIRRQASVASWLHGVAHRTALKLRTEAARRRRREDRAALSRSTAMSDETPWGELRGILDDELGRLPAGCRSALVLCYLEGRTQDEAAAQLGLSKSTLRRRLDRGRVLLGRRLARRGIALGAALGARLVSDCAGAAAPSRTLIMRTAAAVRSVQPAGSAAPAGVVSPRVAALSDGVTKSMQYAKYQSVAAVLACGIALGIGVREFGPPSAAAQDPAPPAAAKSAGPDIEPIDPNLVFDPEIQKQLKLSPNQVQKLAEARDKAAAGAGEHSKKVAAIDQRVKEMQAEMERLQQERNTAQAAVDKAQAGGVKAAIPKVLSRDAVSQLRQMTIQRMRLSDVLLDARVRARLDLNDEQVKKIQEINDKGGGALILGFNQATPNNGTFRLFDTVDYAFAPLRVANLDAARFSTQFLYTDLSIGLTDESRGELIKILTLQQREALEKLSGMTLEKKK